MRSIESIEEEIRKTKKGLKNAIRKKMQCEKKIWSLEVELEEVKKKMNIK